MTKVELPCVGFTPETFICNICPKREKCRALREEAEERKQATSARMWKRLVEMFPEPACQSKKNADCEKGDV